MFIVLCWDGLRPDFVCPELTPNLCRLMENGVTFAKHHAVFPSETRVNASSVSTGCYPGTHGVVGNSIYVPAVNKDVPLNTGNHEDLQAIGRIQNLLSVPTLAEVLRNNNKTYAIFSSGSPGSSWVQCAPNEGHMVNVRGVVHPSQLLTSLQASYGDFPPDTVPATSRNDLVIQMMTDAIEKQAYDVVFGWLCDPDLTQHKVGLGAPMALLAIRENDTRLGALLSVCNEIDVMVCSDHGFSSLADPFDYSGAFQDAGFDTKKIVWTGNGVVLRDDYKNKCADVVHFLSEQGWVGPIFTKGKGVMGKIPGTFSFDVINLNHVRTPDVMFSRNWSNQKNEFGIPGFVFGANGIASHGSCSPYDLHNVLIAKGPNFKNGEVSEIPSGVVDIAPTVLHLTLEKQPTKMDGRVLSEGLVGCDVSPVVDTRIWESKIGSRSQYVQISQVNGTNYIDKGWV